MAEGETNSRDIECIRGWCDGSGCKGLELGLKLMCLKGIFR